MARSIIGVDYALDASRNIESIQVLEINFIGNTIFCVSPKYCTKLEKKQP